MKKLICFTMVALAAALLIKDGLNKVMNADMPEWMREKVNKE